MWLDGRTIDSFTKPNFSPGRTSNFDHQILTSTKQFQSSVVVGGRNTNPTPAASPARYLPFFMILTKSYYPDGTIEAEGFLANNIQVGNWIFYYENGNLFSQGQFNNNGMPIGIWSEYYLNGQKKYEAISKQGNSFSLDSDNLQILNYWSEDGEYIIKNGQGILKTFFENGTIKHMSSWSDNLKNGILQEFYKNGKLKIERQYKDGFKHGEGKTFHENGNLYIQYFYEKGIAVALYKEWYKNGKPCEEGFYKNEKYFTDNFWNEEGIQTLFKGSGYVIKKAGAGEIDIYRLEFENYLMTKEIRL